MKKEPLEWMESQARLAHEQVQRRPDDLREYLAAEARANTSDPHDDVGGNGEPTAYMHAFL